MDLKSKQIPGVSPEYKHTAVITWEATVGKKTLNIHHLPIINY